MGKGEKPQGREQGGEKPSKGSYEKGPYSKALLKKKGKRGQRRGDSNTQGSTTFLSLRKGGKTAEGKDSKKGGSGKGDSKKGEKTGDKKGSKGGKTGGEEKKEGRQVQVWKGLF